MEKLERNDESVEAEGRGSQFVFRSYFVVCGLSPKDEPCGYLLSAAAKQVCGGVCEGPRDMLSASRT